MSTFRRLSTTGRKNDVIAEFLAHYFNVDLVSAGMTRKECAALKGSSLNIMEKWNILKPYWEVCRHTGYGQSPADCSQGDIRD